MTILNAQKLDEYVSISGPESTFLPPFDFDTAVDDAAAIGMNVSYTLEHSPSEWNAGIVTPTHVVWD